MIIGFVGDIHGRVLHTLVLLATWQRKTRRKLDYIIQVGDLGAYPEPDEKLMREKYIQQDASQLDFSRMLSADGELADWLGSLKKELSPIYFIRGNHEDFDWLDSISSGTESIAGVDPFNLLYYVKDGTILQADFMGGIQTKDHKQESINPAAYELLSRLAPGELDILITHDAPYGIGTSFLGETQGSIIVSKLIANIQPRYVIGGHYHHRIGPRSYGDTTYLGLNVLIDLKKDGLMRRAQSGCMAILDTETDRLEFVTDGWISEIDKDFEFVSYMKKLMNRGSDCGK